MLQWLSRRSQTIDLDATIVFDDHFEKITGEDAARERQLAEAEGRVIVDDHPLETTRCWLQYLLKWALDSDAIVIQLLRDTEERCLRQLLYIPREGDSHGYRWFEAIPLGDTFISHGIPHLHKIAKINKKTRTGLLNCLYQGSLRSGIVKIESEIDTAIYFSDARPKLLRLDEPFPR